MEQNLPMIQTSFVEEESFEIVDLIHNFTTSADFAEWVTGSQFQTIIPHSYIADNKYTRTYLYNFEETNFFHGKFEIQTERLGNQTIQAFVNQVPIHSNVEHYSAISKKNISRILAPIYYTIISQLVLNNEPIGMVWEVYNLPQLIKIYNKKNDPLRYWRNNRKP